MYVGRYTSFRTGVFSWGAHMEATLWRIKFYATWIGAFVASILAYFAGFELITKFIHNQTAESIIANAYLATLFFGMMVFTAVRQWNTIRKEKYANITPLLHMLFHQVRDDLDTYIRTKEPKGGKAEEYEVFSNNCKIVFGRILDQLNSVFTSITSTHCRTSIKVLTRTDRMYVCTLSRDQGSRQKWLRLDNKRLRDNLDPLEQNEQFAKLFNDNEEIWHYFCNDLTTESNFRCTSIAAYRPEHARSLVTGERWRFWPFQRNSWPLPYKSTIACVIRQGPFDLRPDIPSEVLGFLTVDSESRGVFEERWDSPIMLAVADALYLPLRAYLDAQNRAQNVP
jgi:hypothetical protein